MKIQIQIDKALQASQSSFLTKGGLYVGSITKANKFKNPSGAGGLELAFDTDGGKCDFVQIFIKNKDGTDNYQVNQLHALGYLLSLLEIDINEKECPTILNKKIGMVLQREDYVKNDGSVGYKFKVLHFIDPVTHQTASEKMKKEEARVALVPVVDSRIESGAKMPAKVGVVTSTSTDPFVDPDLLF